MRTRRKDSFDEDMIGLISDKLEELMTRGMEREEAIVLIVETFSKAAIDVAPGFVEELDKTTPKMLKRHRTEARRFENRLRYYWGDSLDMLYSAIVGQEEVVFNYCREHGPQPGDEFDFLYESLVDLHARACRTAFEVHCLLSRGFPLGAIARCRTLHELAVTALVLDDYGRREEHSDLAEKFFLHEGVDAYKDARLYQEHCPKEKAD